MRISNKWARIVFALALFILVNMAFSYVLRPYSGSGNEMWEGFFSKDKIDMVYTGSSQCLCDINPVKVDEVTGLASYNMGTNMQSLQSSYIALKEAIKQKNISSAVVIIDQDVLEMNRSDNFRAEQCFSRNLSDNLPLLDRIRVDAGFMTDKDFFLKPYSLSYLFPWTYDRTSNIRLNINEKRSNQILDATDHRDENGFYGSDEVCDSSSWQATLEDAKKWSLEAGDLHVLEKNDDNMSVVLDIADMCSQNNVTLYVITVPARSTFTFYDYDGYIAADSYIRENLEPKGVHYYDFNFLKDEYFERLSADNYRDDSHMNTNGANAFSKVLGDVINKLKNNEDVSNMFYDI